MAMSLGRFGARVSAIQRKVTLGRGRASVGGRSGTHVGAGSFSDLSIKLARARERVNQSRSRRP